MAPIACPPWPAEPEVTLRGSSLLSSRLYAAPSSFDGLVRLHFLSRGAISNLFLESQSPLASSQPSDAVLSVRAVGLNFRDVLNVLGEYPGDPGPPGGDCAGRIVDAGASAAVVAETAFGLGHAPLACTALTAAALLAPKPPTLGAPRARRR